MSVSHVLELLLLFLAGGVGLALYLRLKGRQQVLQTQWQHTREQLSAAQTALLAAQQESGLLGKQNAQLTADNTHLLTKLEDKKKEEQQWHERLQLQFKNLANELLETKSQKFAAQNQTNLEALLKPLGEKIVAFEKTILQTNEADVRRSASLSTEIRQLYELNARITQEAANLTRAIKGDNKVQGDWGEFILASILEKSGLAEGREYFLQHSFKGVDGQTYRPDALIKLPENKHIIIDAKASLTAYEAFANASDDNERELHLKRHLQSVRSHLQGLHRKSYQAQYAPQKLDFVLMFLPIEPAFSLAVQRDTSLFQDAYKRNVILVSPTTLIATLKTIASIWRNEHQNQNALEIARQGGNLFDKFVGFIQDFDKIEDQLIKVQKTHELAKNKLYTGHDNLINKVQRLKKLGAATSKQLDTELLEKAQAQAEELEEIPTSTSSKA